MEVQGGSQYAVEEGSGGLGQMDFDYDSMYSYRTECIKWLGTYWLPWATWRTTYNKELHGVFGQESFVDATNNNFHLQSDAIGVNKGVILTGFNDANSPWPYKGSAPDIGAYEYDSGAPTYALGDFNQDGKVNLYDVSIMLSKWRSANSSDLTLCDINAGPSNISQGKIDLYDANLMMANWRP